MRVEPYQITNKRSQSRIHYSNLGSFNWGNLNAWVLGDSKGLYFIYNDGF